MYLIASLFSYKLPLSWGLSYCICGSSAGDVRIIRVEKGTQPSFTRSKFYSFFSPSKQQVNWIANITRQCHHSHGVNGIKLLVFYKVAQSQQAAFWSLALHTAEHIVKLFYHISEGLHQSAKMIHIFKRCMIPMRAWN